METRTALTVIALATVIGFMFGCWYYSPPRQPIYQPSAVTPAAVIDPRLSTPRDHPREEKADLGETCTYSETGNGFVTRCGPTQEKVMSDSQCPDGQAVVCVRRYGTRECGCYPDGLTEEERNE